MLVGEEGMAKMIPWVLLFQAFLEGWQGVCSAFDLRQPFRGHLPLQRTLPTYSNSTV